MESHLIARSKVEINEPIRSLVLRLSEASGFFDPRSVLRLAGLRSGFVTTPCDLSELARLTGNDIDSLQRATYWTKKECCGAAFLNQTIPASYISVSHPKICPLCVSQSGFCESLWDLLFCTVCPTHKLQLVSRCRVCDGELGWFRRGLLTCSCASAIENCGNPFLGDVPPDYEISDALHLLSKPRGISETFGRYSTLAPISSLADLVVLMGFFACELKGEHRRPGLPSKQIEYLAPKLDQIHKIVFRWPLGFYDWAGAHFVERSGHQSFGLQERFGKFPDRLRATFKPRPTLRFVLKSFAEYLASSPASVFPLKSHSVFASEDTSNQRNLFANEAAKFLHMRPSSVFDLVRSGRLAGAITQIGSRQTCVVSREDLSAYLEHPAEKLTGVEIAELLGITSLGVEKLRRAGLIQGAERYQGRYRFLRSTFDSFVEKLLSTVDATCQPPLPPTYVSISELIGRKIISLIDAIASVHAGRLKVCLTSARILADQPILDQVFVDQDSILGRTRHQGADVGLGVDFAAKQLGLNPRMIPVLVKAGCITPTPAALRKPLRKCGLSETSVQAFKAQYCLSTEISAILGTSTSRVLEIARTRGIRPVVRSSSKSGISAVWTRSDLKRFID